MGVCVAVGGELVEVAGIGVSVAGMGMGVAAGAQPTTRRKHTTSSERNLMPVIINSLCILVSLHRSQLISYSFIHSLSSHHCSFTGKNQGKARASAQKMLAEITSLI
jgi:hypothetical protein